MGARQRAQKRGKAAKGSQKGTPASQKRLNSSMHVPDLSPNSRRSALLGGWQDMSPASSPSERRMFTMGDTARHTERHTFGWGSSKLRDRGISFVSAGTLHQEPEHVRSKSEIKQEENQPEQGEKQQQDYEVEPDLENGQHLPEINVTPVTDNDKQPANIALTAHPMAFRPRVVSSTSSSSGGEEIVFLGRSKRPTPNGSSLGGSKRASRTPSLPRASPPKDRAKPATTSIEKLTTKTAIPRGNVAKELDSAPSSSEPRVTNTGLRRKGRGRRRQSDIDEEEAIMRDYIANMAVDDTENDDAPVGPQPSQTVPRSTRARRNETVRYYNGDGEENAKVQIRSRVKASSKKDIEQAMDWNSDDLRDFDDLSTTDDEVDEISQVLRHRQRETGPQYLVTPLGSGASDAKWVLHARLVSDSAVREISIFQDIQAMEFEEESLDDDDDDDDDDDEDYNQEDETTDSELEEALDDLIGHIDSEDDENARIMKYTARMSDEQIARALAKQEELGLGGDELMIFNGEVDDGEESEVFNMDAADAFGRNDDFISFSLKQHTSNRTRSNRNKKKRDSFPSAAAFADALDEDPYGGFDVMDFDRPSLRPRKKGRKSDFPFDLQVEDEELRDQLVSTWMNDRDKKAQRKREKEEARQAVMLEYADRSEPAAIKAEIRRFLVQETDTLRLAPMDSTTRAAVHRLAKALKLNSRSEGKDGTPKGRHPVLTKTIRTPQYSIDSIWEVDALLNTRKFFPKNAGSYKKDKLARGTARALRVRRSGDVAGASYMNGEIVGASAPEIGSDNRGRAMLEKMGWMSGMAIGAEGNKGSLEAVKHVFKTSRAGLG